MTEQQAALLRGVVIVVIVQFWLVCSSIFTSTFSLLASSISIFFTRCRNGLFEINTGNAGGTEHDEIRQGQFPNATLNFRHVACNPTLFNKTLIYILGVLFQGPFQVSSGQSGVKWTPACSYLVQRLEKVGICLIRTLDRIVFEPEIRQRWYVWFFILRSIYLADNCYRTNCLIITTLFVLKRRLKIDFQNIFAYF